MPRLVARFGALLALFLMFGGYAPGVRSAELVMVERDGCPWCEAFDREISPIYAKTPEGRRAPLRRIDLYQPVPADLSALQIERLTHAFILVGQGREIARIRGYPGPEGFWTQLTILMDRLPNKPEQNQAALATPLRAD